MQYLRRYAGHASQACHTSQLASCSNIMRWACFRHGTATRIAVLLGFCMQVVSCLVGGASSSHIPLLIAHCKIYLPLECSIDHVICDKVSCLDSLAAAASAAENVMLCSDQPLRLPAWLFMPPAAHRQYGF
ncbi:TPA: hypothetical protein ACH3X1_000836 [Trebouxia sp. C0004]